MRNAEMIVERNGAHTINISLLRAESREQSRLLDCTQRASSCASAAPHSACMALSTVGLMSKRTRLAGLGSVRDQVIKVSVRAVQSLSIIPPHGLACRVEEEEAIKVPFHRYALE